MRGGARFLQPGARSAAVHTFTAPILARLRHAPLLAAALPLLAAAAAAQQPDTTRADTTRAQPLPAVRVEVTGEADRLGRVPWAVGVADRREIQRGQPTVGLDEALSGIPGVHVANRYNFALDQRLVVRGFGTRANFGVRGVKILLDGIPQTFPDGQSQLTNVELGAISRVEVLRGSASSLYGNGAGGVVAFTSDLAAPEGLGASVRAEGGAFGLGKVQARVAGRSDRLAGALSLSRLTWTGFRDGYGAAELRQLNSAADLSLSPTTTLSVRAHVADTPEAENPGALTAAEFAANPDSAAVNNVRRGADKVVSQQQLSVRLRRELEAGLSFDASVYGIRRDLQNAIAAAPPDGGGPENGVFITLDREAGGARASATWRAEHPRTPSLTLGAEWQRMRDLRENRRATRGRPREATDTLLLSQIETVESVGPFA
jgi:iron complex outermembrane recepter protein